MLKIVLWIVMLYIVTQMLMRVIPGESGIYILWHDYCREVISELRNSDGIFVTSLGETACFIQKKMCGFIFPVIYQ
ncbi:MAG: hypothetical protein LBQ22_00390, partial [Bacteroidales bacterium]|nr:hypothetical protein [Bacteroidales bacterium]